MRLQPVTLLRRAGVESPHTMRHNFIQFKIRRLKNQEVPQISPEQVYWKASNKQFKRIGEVLGREPTPELAVGFAENCREISIRWRMKPCRKTRLRPPNRRTKITSHPRIMGTEKRTKDNIAENHFIIVVGFGQIPIVPYILVGLLVFRRFAFKAEEFQKSIFSFRDASSVPLVFAMNFWRQVWYRCIFLKRTRL